MQLKEDHWMMVVIEKRGYLHVAVARLICHRLCSGFMSVSNCN